MSLSIKSIKFEKESGVCLMKRYVFLAMLTIALVCFFGSMLWAEDVSFLSDQAFLEDGHFLPNVPKPSEAYEIANVTRTLLNAHWVKNRDGFMDALKHYGLEGQVFAVQSEQDVVEQANILDTVIRKGYNAIVVSPISEQNLLPGLSEATKKDIVIINVDTAKISEEDAKKWGIEVATFIGSDNYDSGVKAAEFIAEVLKDTEAEVAVVEGRPGDTCAIDRSSGFRDTVTKHSNLKLVADQSANWDRLQALDVTTNMLRAHPSIKGIYFNNDTMVLGGIQAAENLGYKVLTASELNKINEEKTIVIIGNDGIPEAMQAIQEGNLTGTIAQKPYLMGYAAVEAAIIALEGGSLPEAIHTPIKLVTAEDFE